MDKAEFKEIRKRTGLNQTEFGKLLGLEQYQVRDIETGNTKISKSLEKLLQHEFVDVGKSTSNIEFTQHEPTKEELSAQRELFDLAREMEKRKQIYDYKKKFIEEQEASGVYTPEEAKKLIKDLAEKELQYNPG